MIPIICLLRGNHTHSVAVTFDIVTVINRTDGMNAAVLNDQILQTFEIYTEEEGFKIAEDSISVETSKGNFLSNGVP